MTVDEEIRMVQALTEPALALYSSRYDFAKHLSSLNAGGVLFVSAYLAITSGAPYMKLLTLFSILLFGFSMILSLGEMLFLTNQKALLSFRAVAGTLERQTETMSKRDHIILWSQRIAVILFLIGILLAALVVYSSAGRPRSLRGSIRSADRAACCVSHERHRPPQRSGPGSPGRRGSR